MARTLLFIFRQVKGVIQINIDDRKDNRRATISIYAETEDAAKKARQVNKGRGISSITLGTIKYF